MLGAIIVLVIYGMVAGRRRGVTGFLRCHSKRKRHITLLVLVAVGERLSAHRFLMNPRFHFLRQDFARWPLSRETLGGTNSLGAIWSKQRCIQTEPFKQHRETFQMKEIKPDQRWSEGVNEVQVTNAFGVRIRIRRSGAQADEEITEDEFRKRFTFVAGR